ncbi:MAG: hypothetical protein Q9M11_07145 [Mariprofundaceae bacterium]|nr:hypothetical protein [Mariprofundaceae bacterium]
MGWLKNLFGKGESSDSENVRSLNHAAELNKGDIIKMSFLDQQDLSNKRFEVSEVNSYDFEREQETSFTLKGQSGDIFFLSVCNDNGKESLSFSRLLKRSQVLDLFSENDFSHVFNEGAGSKLERKSIPASFEDWTSATYVEEEDCVKGYYHKGDYRKRSIPRIEDESCGLEYYLLAGLENNVAIEIEVYASGETEVSAVVYLDMSAIEEMWPAT